MQGQGCLASTIDKQLPQDEHDFTFHELILTNEGRQASLMRSPPSPSQVSQEEMQEYLKKCVADDSTLDLVEQRTRGQTSCKLWQELHKGRITSSRFGEVARLQTSTCPDRLVADIMGYSDHVSTPAMRWARTMRTEHVQPISPT